MGHAAALMLLFCLFLSQTQELCGQERSACWCQPPSHLFRVLISRTLKEERQAETSLVLQVCP